MGAAGGAAWGRPERVGRPAGRPRGGGDAAVLPGTGIRGGRHYGFGPPLRSILAGPPWRRLGKLGRSSARPGAGGIRRRAQSWRTRNARTWAGHGSGSSPKYDLGCWKPACHALGCPPVHACDGCQRRPAASWFALAVGLPGSAPSLPRELPRIRPRIIHTRPHFQLFIIRPFPLPRHSSLHRPGNVLHHDSRH